LNEIKTSATPATSDIAAFRLIEKTGLKRMVQKALPFVPFRCGCSHTVFGTFSFMVYWDIIICGSDFRGAIE